MTIGTAARRVLKSVTLRALGSPFAIRHKLERLARTGALTILNLHQVGPGKGTAYPPLSPELFEYLLVFLREHFQIVTFSQLPCVRGERPAVILSFDDAYEDFAEHALPLLRKHGVTVNQNVIPACAETGLPPLNVLVYEFIGRAPPAVVASLNIPGFDQHPLLKSPAALGNAIATYLKRMPMAEQERIRAVVLPQLLDHPELLTTRMMRTEALREIAGEHELGAHSYHHASMAFETDDYLVADIAACRRFFEDSLGIPLTVYALPNGSYREGQIELIRAAGISHILLVDEDFSRCGFDVHPRITFDAHSRHEARFRATGAYRWPSLRNARP